MSTLSHTFTSTEAPGAASATFFLRDGQAANLTAVGTIDDGCEVALQRKQGAAWVDERRWSAGSINASGVIKATGGNHTYRFLADVPTTDPATTLASFAVTLADQVNVLEETRSPSGKRVFAMTDDGIESTKVTATEVTDGTARLTQGSLLLSAGCVQHNNGQAAGSVASGYGRTSAEGMQVYILEETISFVDNAALYKAMTTPIPAGAVILSVQANIESALTGGSTTVKVGLGPNASDPDKYGKTSALTKNAKISTIPTHAVLATQEAIDVCACATNGAAGDTALTVGSVRVRIVFIALANLADA